ncbi:MAG: ribonuclease III [Saprospiraceae bacterium]|nr:ribonuclease III [Saprospiraceae bacterium]
MKVFNPVKAHFSSEKDLFESIKNIFGFYPGNIFLYRLAFRHKSVATELKDGVKDSNERLEYLGDAILSAVVADYLFKKFPYKDEGFLTEMRSKLVSRSQFNKLAIKLGVDKFVNSTQDSNNIPKSIFGDAFEALIGAIYLDKGYEFTRKIIIEKIIKIHLDIEEIESTDKNFKSKLIEWVQKEKMNLEFKVVEEIGEGNYKQYLVEVFIDEVSYGMGQDFSIKAAEQNAAEKACIKAEIVN